MRTKVMIYYKDGSKIKINCKAMLTNKYVLQYLNNFHVKKITSQNYPLSGSVEVIHKDVKIEVTP